jgi:hypothetical protein
LKAFIFIGISDEYQTEPLNYLKEIIINVALEAFVFIILKEFLAAFLNHVI